MILVTHKLICPNGAVLSTEATYEKINDLVTLIVSHFRDGEFLFKLRGLEIHDAEVGLYTAYYLPASRLEKLRFWWARFRGQAQNARPGQAPLSILGGVQ